MCFGYDGEGALRHSLEREGLQPPLGPAERAATLAGAAVVGSGAGPAAAVARSKPWKRVPPDKISIQL